MKGKRILVKVLYGVLGIVLAVMVVITKPQKLNKTDMQIYKGAVELNDQVQQLGLPNFDLTQMKVRCYDGSKDYVLSVENGKVSCEKENSKLNLFAATICEEEGEYQILIPTLEQFQELFQAGKLLDNNENESFAMGGEDYGKNEQIATIWHEATHVWEFSHFGEKIQERYGLCDDAQTIIETLDRNTELKHIYHEELDLLSNAAKCENIDEIKKYMIQYRKLEELKSNLLEEDSCRIEQYYIVVEGFANYVEGEVYKIILGDDAYEKRYSKLNDGAMVGTHKYYELGRLQCLILDKVLQNWKEDYDFSKSMSELLSEIL